MNQQGHDSEGDVNLNVFAYRLKVLEEQGKETLKTIREMFSTMEKTFVRNDTYALEKLAQDDEIKQVRKSITDLGLSVAAGKTRSVGNWQLFLTFIGSLLVAIIGALIYVAVH